MKRFNRQRRYVKSFASLPAERELAAVLREVSLCTNIPPEPQHRVEYFPLHGSIIATISSRKTGGSAHKSPARLPSMFANSTRIFPSASQRIQAASSARKMSFEKR